MAFADASVAAPYDLKIGQSIADFEGRWSKTLCDRDPIDGRTRTIWFHAPCRKAESLPDQTIVVLYTKGSDPGEPLEAMAWFGDWPRRAGAFPLPVGVDHVAAERALGKAQRLFDFSGIVDGGEAIVVWRHPKDVYSIERAGKTFGYVAGRMGDDPQREEWRGLVANVLRALKRR